MTSNLGSNIIQENFDGIKESEFERVYEATKTDVFGLLKKSMRPEFINRIDETIMFTPLSRSNMVQIVKIQLAGVAKLAKQSDINLSFADEAIEFISNEGFDPQFGARPVKRVIQKKVLNELSKQILAGKVQAGDKIVMDVFDQQIVFRAPIEKEQVV